MRASALTAGPEPLVQTRWVELDIALLAGDARQLPIGCTDDTVADEAGLNASKLLFQVGLPHTNAIQHTLVLVAQEDCDRQQPLAQAAILDANLRGSQSMAGRE